MDWPLILGSGLSGLLLGVAAYWFYARMMARDAQSKARTILDNARRDSETKCKEAELRIREMELNQKAAVETEWIKVREDSLKQQRDLEKQRATVEQQADDVRKQERIVETTQERLKKKLDSINQRETEINQILEKQRVQLHKITGLSREDATQRLLKLLDAELAHEMGTKIIEHERRLNEQIDVKSREILLMACQRFASKTVAESTTSTIDIPNDEMKGRIIGREGRNIRSFEKETGVDVIIDDTPGVVIISGFDPVRREVARLALNRLIADGRIHPTRIEEIVKETSAEIDDLIVRKGTEAVQEVELRNVHERIIQLLGRLHFRTSYSQNVLQHSIEVAFLAGIMAEMIGLDPGVAKRCGLFHDLGKAADHELEGGHPKIGADLLKRHGESAEVVHAALGHHDDIVIEHPYTVLVATADACSASRPGARRESLERYVKRMEELESIAKGFAEVEQAFAIQAGRELRVIVSSDNTDDAAAAKICRDIANACQEQLTFPGEIRVTVIRESRFVELAK
jgi:ribonuclease Y